MPIRQDRKAIGSLVASQTFFPHRPVEEGRGRGVASLTLIGNGTASAVAGSNRVTTNERPPTVGSGLTVGLTAAGGIYTAVAIVAGGTRYTENQIIRVVNAAGVGILRLQVVAVSILGAVTQLAILTNVSSGATTATPRDTFPENSQGGQGLTVTNTAAGGIVTGLSIGNSAGTGYRIGDIVTILGTSGTTPVTASVASLTG